MAGKDRASDQPEVYVISIAAELAGMHAQTLRTYDRLGLVTPRRTRGGGRRYSPRDVQLLREIQKLSQEDGVNLAGIKAIIALQRENERLKAENTELETRLAELNEENRRLRERAGRFGGEVVHVPRSTAIVAWTPRGAARRRKRS